MILVYGQHLNFVADYKPLVNIFVSKKGIEVYNRL